MSRTYAASALSSSPDSAAILALLGCSAVGSGDGAASRPHSSSIADGSMYLRPDQSSDASQQTAPTSRTSASSDGKLWTAPRAALDLAAAALPHAVRPDAAAVGLGEVEVCEGVRLGPP